MFRGLSAFLLLALSFCVSLAAGVISVDAKFSEPPKTGDNELTLSITDADKQPVFGAKVSLDVLMTNMNMGIAHPMVTEKAGIYTAAVRFSMEGPWRVTVKVEVKGSQTVTKNFDFKVGASSDMDMKMSGMKGRLGNWPMSREGSGTCLLPESSPMFMKMLRKNGRYDLNAMGFITFNENISGSRRAGGRFFSNSMLMLMGQRETGGGTIGLSFMGSLDPVFNGEYGYPDLFQTGETAYGKKLTDYQHPHDLVAEATVSYSHPIGGGVRAFVYAGPVGEPALGGPTFMHRPSGMEIPEAPISHHWFDSTHIAWGVATVGLNTDKWQIEASAFNGHEPDENRYSPDPIRLNSASGRATFSPNKNLAFNVSYGYLKSPESSEPGVDQHRVTASGVWNLPLGRGDNLAATVAWGRNVVGGRNSDSFLAESTYMRGPTSLFARWEHVMKDELVGVPAGNYMINKFLVGAVRDFAKRGGLDFGVGAYAGFYLFPDSLNSFYGKSPVTFGVFLRIRPARMEHETDKSTGSADTPVGAAPK